MTGLTMIEVLVTLIILAVGLLGIAALQIVGLRSTGSSENRTQATLFANEIAERMRANISAVNSNQFSAVTQNTINCAAAPAPFCSDNFNGGVAVAAAACTPTEMAAFDLKEWYCGVFAGNTYVGGVANTLPSSPAPTVSITCNDISAIDADACTDHSPHTITIGWIERNPDRSSGAAATVTQSVSMTIQP